jgi:hypothetical protein
MKLLLSALLAVSLTGAASATLPPPTPEAQAKAADAAAKAAWDDKVALYKLCMAMDRTAAAYRQNLKDSAAQVPAPQSTADCADPGPYVTQQAATPSASKPLEASGAHSPPGIAATPPSTPTPSAENSGSKNSSGG